MIYYHHLRNLMTVRLLVFYLVSEHLKVCKCVYGLIKVVHVGFVLFCLLKLEEASLCSSEWTNVKSKTADLVAHFYF
jgi:hypothetical protein